MKVADDMFSGNEFTEGELNYSQNYKYYPDSARSPHDPVYAFIIRSLVEVVFHSINVKI